MSDDRRVRPAYARPHSELLETWPRRREFAWMALAAVLAIIVAVGGPDERAHVVAQKTSEEEGARPPRPAMAPLWLVEGEPRVLMRSYLTYPLQCPPDRAQVLYSWGSGRSIYQRQRDGHPARRCVNADLRRHPHVP